MNVMVNNMCIGKVKEVSANPQMKQVILKGRSVGPSTFHGTLKAWGTHRLHFVDGLELVDEVNLNNFQDLLHVFDSDANDWPASWQSQRKKTREKRKQLSLYQTDHEGAYLRVISNYLPSQTLLYIDTEGNKQFLSVQKENYVLEGDVYMPVEFKDVLQQTQAEERDNLLFFLNHA